jgi:cytochrome c-type biogenesis protein CcmH/NrfG
VTAHRVLAEAAVVRADSGEAAAQLAGALDVLREHPAPLEAWRVHAVIGRVRAAFGAAAEASQAYREAWLVAQGLAGSVDDAALGPRSSAPACAIAEGAEPRTAMKRRPGRSAATSAA